MGIGGDLKEAHERQRGVGDIGSTQKGSAARYNGGKPDMSLIPLDILVDSFHGIDQYAEVKAAVRCVGLFQMGGDADNLHTATRLLHDYWGDCANVFTYGKEKYAAWNWAKGMDWSIPIACIGRHFEKIALGEWLDNESGHPHIGHIMCNIVMLIHYTRTYLEGDDRIKHAE